MEGGGLAGGKRAAAELGAWLCSGDGSGQGLRPPAGRTPVVTVTGTSSPGVPLAALIAVKAGQRPRLICRVHAGRGRGEDGRKGFTGTGCARLLAAAHQQLGGPIVLVQATCKPTPAER